MPEQLINGVVIHRVGRLTGAALAEGKGLPLPAAHGLEAGGMDVNALGAVLGAAHHHRLSGFQVAELHRSHLPLPQDRHAVHTALLRQEPLAVDLEILGKNAGGVIALRGHPIPGSRVPPRVRAGLKPGQAELGRVILWQGKGHCDNLRLMLCLVWISTHPADGGPLRPDTGKDWAFSLTREGPVLCYFTSGARCNTPPSPAAKPPRRHTTAPAPPAPPWR